MERPGRLLFIFLFVGIVIACEKNVDPSDAGNSDRDSLPDPTPDKKYTVIQDTFQGVPLVIIGSLFIYLYQQAIMCPG